MQRNPASYSWFNFRSPCELHVFSTVMPMCAISHIESPRQFVKCNVNPIIFTIRYVIHPSLSGTGFRRTKSYRKLKSDQPNISWSILHIVCYVGRGWGLYHHHSFAPGNQFGLRPKPEVTLTSSLILSDLQHLPVFCRGALHSCCHFLKCWLLTMLCIWMQFIRVTIVNRIAVHYASDCSTYNFNKCNLICVKQLGNWIICN